MVISGWAQIVGCSDSTGRPSLDGMREMRQRVYLLVPSLLAKTAVCGSDSALAVA